ncbi:MAG: hypothetical protein L0154_19045 [Chloroflexi bacterium]|nr:hypothetical protein [Chloroflexota bacterium]
MKKLIFLSIMFILALTACQRSSGDDDPDPTATPTVPQITVIVSQAPVFDRPDSAASVIINLFEGDSRVALSRSIQDSVGVFYYEINLGSRTGWIAATQVELGGDINRLMIFDPSLMNIPPERMPSVTPAGAGEPPVARIKVERATVLDAPRRDGEAVTSLFNGEEIAALRVTEPDALSDVYYEVMIGTQTGWVLSSQVDISGDTQLIEVVSLADLENATAVAAGPSLTPSEAAAGPTTVPTEANTSTPTLTVTPGPSPTITPHPDGAIFPQPPPTNTPVPDPAMILQGEPPPLDITIPDNWEEIHAFVPVVSQFASGNVAMSVYEGPISGDLTGTIWIVWGFPAVVDPFGEELDMWSSAIQILRGIMFRGCNIGLVKETEYPIGDAFGSGSTFSAVTCDEGEDIAGYFAGVEEQGGYYTFIMGVKPVDRVLEGLPFLRDIIASVHFHDIPTDS